MTVEEAIWVTEAVQRLVYSFPWVSTNGLRPELELYDNEWILLLCSQRQSVYLMLLVDF